MEITAQWLDELEDLVFAVALLWEPLRRILLQIGLVAAITSHLSRSGSDVPAYAPILAGVAAGAVAVWCLALLVLLFVTLSGAEPRNTAVA
ncbi:MAG TPA: hypothetical protein VIM81_16360 [Gammaproteobacteria bacterium]